MVTESQQPSLRVVDLITTDANKTYEPAGRMAEAIIAHTQIHGRCLPQDLNAYGFSPDHIATHWHLAQALAAVELKLMQDGAKLQQKQWR